MSDPSRKIRRRACRGKKRYYSAIDAKNAILSYRVTLGENMQYYYCRFDGGHYHIGHDRRSAYERIETALKIAAKRYG